VSAQGYRGLGQETVFVGLATTPRAAVNEDVDWGVCGPGLEQIEILDVGLPVPSFIAGQHVAVAVAGTKLERHYSLVSCGHSSSDSLAIAIRRVGSGGLSDLIHAELRQGAPVALTAPGGRLRLPLRSSRPLLLVAGGIGITPFLGYIRTLVTTRSFPPPAVTLVYASRDDAFDAELRGLDLPNLTYRRYPSGRPAVSAIEDVAPDTRAFLCGPDAFMRSARSALYLAGLTDSSIVEERFVAAAPSTKGLSAARVTLGISGQEFVWQPSQASILVAAEAAGIRLVNGCRAGECESCALRLLAGHVSHTRDAPEDGTCLTCCSVPVGDVTLAA
jgi:ferredoxin-NADP reductase